MLSPIKIFPLFLSLSACLFLSFLAESVKLIGLPRFLVVAIIVDRPRRMSRDPFKGGVYSNRLYFFCVPVKNKIHFFYLSYLCYAIDLDNIINVKVLSLNKVMKQIIRSP